jgi:hypothetical protein
VVARRRDFRAATAKAAQVQSWATATQIQQPSTSRCTCAGARLYKLQGAQACAGSKLGAGESVAAARLTLAELQTFVRVTTGEPAPQTPQRPELEVQVHARGSPKRAPHRRVVNEGIGLDGTRAVRSGWLHRPQPQM